MIRGKNHGPWGKILFFLGIFLFVLFPGFGQLKPKNILEREERSTTFPNENYRERSYQRITYNYISPYLSSEFDIKHLDYKFSYGRTQQEMRFYQASFKGQNLGNKLVTKVGRIWAGNDIFRPIDGISLFHPFGKSLAGTVILGKTPIIGRDMKSDKPTVTEGRLDYRFNKNAFLAFKASQEERDHYSSAQLGYSIVSLTALGEFKTTGATDTYRISFQYFDDQSFDLTSDYRWQMQNGLDTGIFRNTIALTIGTCYFETGLGRKFNLNQNSDFYEGTIYSGNSRVGENNFSLGYLLEILPKTESRTFSGDVERIVTKKTSIGISMEDTRFNDGRSSIQNIGGRLNRKVFWGYFEVLAALINGGDRSNLERDVRLRAGYEF